MKNVIDTSAQFDPASLIVFTPLIIAVCLAAIAMVAIEVKNRKRNHHFKD